MREAKSLEANGKHVEADAIFEDINIKIAQYSPGFGGMQIPIPSTAPPTASSYTYDPTVAQIDAQKAPSGFEYSPAGHLQPVGTGLKYEVAQFLAKPVAFKQSPVNHDAAPTGMEYSPYNYLQPEGTGLKWQANQVKTKFPTFVASPEQLQVNPYLPNAAATPTAATPAAAAAPNTPVQPAKPTPNSGQSGQSAPATAPKPAAAPTNPFNANGTLTTEKANYKNQVNTALQGEGANIVNATEQLAQQNTNEGTYVAKAIKAYKDMAQKIVTEQPSYALHPGQVTNWIVQHARVNNQSPQFIAYLTQVIPALVTNMAKTQPLNNSPQQATPLLNNGTDQASWQAR